MWSQNAFGLVALGAALLMTGCGGSQSAGNGGTSTATLQATATPNGTATPTTNTSPLGSTRTNPVPFGQTATVAGWTVKVISVAPETTDPSVGAPPAGTVFEVFTLQVTNTSATPAAPSLSLISDLVGSTNVSYSVDTSPLCYGGTPDNDNVYQGGTVQFGACISVPSSVTGLLLNVSGFLSTNSVWFATQ